MCRQYSSFGGWNTGSYISVFSNASRHSNALRKQISGKAEFFQYVLNKDHLFSMFAKFSEKLTFLYPLIHTRTCAYQGVRNVSFSENFANVIDE